MESKTLVIIPAFNEEASIAHAVEALVSTCPHLDYIVINDGSTDSTAAVCAQHGYPCISLFTNLGLAGAFRTGVKYALRRGYTYVIQYDADGQHDPQYLDAMIAAAQDASCDIVIGSRFVTKPKPRTARMAGSMLIELIIRLTTGSTIHDPTSGMRLYGPRVIDIYAQGFDITPEPDTLALLMRNGMNVSEVQVEMHERIAGQSYLTITKSISYMLRISMAILFANRYRSCQ